MYVLVVKKNEAFVVEVWLDCDYRLFRCYRQFICFSHEWQSIKEKEFGKRLEVDLEREYKTKFDLEYTRYDATRSEYGAIFHTNEPDKKDDVSFYATYHNDYELYDTYREEIWSRDIRKAVTNEAKEVY